MLKTIAFSLLIAVISTSQPNWIGKWYVVSSTTTGTNSCIVPEAGKILDLTLAPSGLLSLDNYDENGNIILHWDLIWHSEKEKPSYCSVNVCTGGSLGIENGIPHATISWNISIAPEIVKDKCSIVLTPSELSWVGRWNVAKSGSNNLNECNVPKTREWVNITLQEDRMTLAAVDLLQGDVSSWDLKWHPNKLKVDEVCNDGKCIAGQLSIIDGYLYGQINWKASGSDTHCYAHIYRAQKPSLDGDCEPTMESFYA